MHSNSRPVSSPQSAAHPGLPRFLHKQQQSPYRKPLPTHNRILFDNVQEILATQVRPLVLDAGCGNATSSLELARHNPERWIIGVDKSHCRLQRHLAYKPVRQIGNCVLVCMDLCDFWRLAFAAGWRLHAHYLLYPNPWPRPAQIKRRWHAHPVFQYALTLGGFMELRTNWSVYAQEFASVLQRFGYLPEFREITVTSPLSPFEEKYAASSHRLYRCYSNLDAVRRETTTRWLLATN